MPRSFQLLYSNKASWDAGINRTWVSGTLGKLGAWHPKDSVWNLGSLLRSSMGEPWWCFDLISGRCCPTHTFSALSTPTDKGSLEGGFESLYNSLVLKGTLLCSRVFWQNGLSSSLCRLQSSHCVFVSDGWVYILPTLSWWFSCLGGFPLDLLPTGAVCSHEFHN